MRQIYRMVAYRLIPELGDGEVGREAPSDGAGLGGVREHVATGYRASEFSDQLLPLPISLAP